MAHRTFTEDELAEAERKDCASCSKPLAFVTYDNPAGKRVRLPVSLATMQSHFLDCDNPQRFSRATGGGRRML